MEIENARISKKNILFQISDRKFSVSVSAKMTADISVSVSVSAIFIVSVSAEMSVHLPAKIFQNFG
jgi:hypothetical protein